MEARTHLAAIIDSSFDAIISKDLSGTILSWNPAAERMFGFAPAEAIGQNIGLIIPQERMAEEQEIIRRIGDGERIEPFETTRVTSRNMRLDVSLTISPIRDDRGRVVGASKIARDITHAKDQERRLHGLMKEVNHRVRNQYAILLSLMRQTAREETDIEQFEQRMRGRVMALALTQDLLTEAQWGPVDLRRLVEFQFGNCAWKDRIVSAGPNLLLQPNALLHLALALEELTSPLASAVDGEEGSVASLTWDEAGTTDKMLRVTWKQRGGAGAGLAAGNVGSRILESVVPRALFGQAQLAFEDGDLSWSLQAPLSSIAEPRH